MFLTERTGFTERKKREYSSSVVSVRAKSGFSLIELMMVMGVIVILVAMLFPVILGQRAKAKKKQALVEAHNIVLALKAYNMDYGKWPNQSQAASDTTYFADNHLIIKPLIGDNPRGKVYLAVQPLSSNVDSSGRTNFIGQMDFLANYVDPWGVPYVICMDEDMNGDSEIYLKNVIYTNIFSVPQTIYSYSATNYFTNYIAANVDVAVASFADKTNANPSNAAFEVETWSEPR